MRVSQQTKPNYLLVQSYTSCNDQKQDDWTTVVDMCIKISKKTIKASGEKECLEKEKRGHTVCTDKTS